MVDEGPRQADFLQVMDTAGKLTLTVETCHPCSVYTTGVTGCAEEIITLLLQTHQAARYRRIKFNLTVAKQSMDGYRNIYFKSLSRTVGIIVYDIGAKPYNLRPFHTNSNWHILGDNMRSWRKSIILCPKKHGNLIQKL